MTAMQTESSQQTDTDPLPEDRQFGFTQNEPEQCKRCEFIRIYDADPEGSFLRNS